MAMKRHKSASFRSESHNYSVVARIKSDLSTGGPLNTVRETNGTCPPIFVGGNDSEIIPEISSDYLTKQPRAPTIYNMVIGPKINKCTHMTPSPAERERERDPSFPPHPHIPQLSH